MFDQQIPGELSEDRIHWRFPIVKTRNRNDVETTWSVIVGVVYEGETPELDVHLPIDAAWFANTGVLPMRDGKSAVGWIKVMSGQVGGKVRKAPPTYVRVGKNPGKKNATNPFMQALRDALSKYNKQATITATQIEGLELKLPMLAQSLKDQKNFDWEQTLFYQTKFNGVRAVVAVGPGDQPIIYSRTGKIYPGFGYMRDDMRSLLLWLKTEFNLVCRLDGEVYKHNTDLQLISGTARRELNHKDADPTALKLEFHVYDLIVDAEPTMNFSDRRDMLDEARARWLDVAHPYIRFVVTTELYDPKQEQLDKAYASALNDGFEGVMLRRDLPYETSPNNYHSKHLLKIKPALDGEFKIIGFAAGRDGKSEGTLMFELETDRGFKFTANLGMPIEERKELYIRMSTIEANNCTVFINQYYGKKLTIVYDELSTDGVPLRVRTNGIIIRDYE